MGFSSRVESKGTVWEPCVRREPAAGGLGPLLPAHQSRDNDTIFDAHA